MSKRVGILVISDGKPGHENQSVGLAEAIGRIEPIELRIVKVERGFVKTLRSLADTAEKFEDLVWVFGAGHGVHAYMLWFSFRFRVRTVCLMKPSWPLSWFTWCVVPEHDFLDSKAPKNVLLTKGALNRVVYENQRRQGKLVLIGGPSKVHGWDEEKLLEELERLMVGQVTQWLIADSRRTPNGFLERVAIRWKGINTVSWKTCGIGWLKDALITKEEVAVTEDSVSMIYEALSSGAQVQILPMPRKRRNARVLQGLMRLEAEGYFDPRQEKIVLAEAARCAKIIVEDGFTKGIFSKKFAR